MLGSIVVGNLVVLLVELAILGIMIYGLCWMLGGPRAANGFARGANRTAQRGVRFVGRGTGRAVQRTSNAYPLATGILMILFAIWVMSKC